MEKLYGEFVRCTITAIIHKKYPADFVPKVKQINSQSDLISMSSFAGLSYLTIRSFVSIILI